MPIYYLIKLVFYLPKFINFSIFLNVYYLYSSTIQFSTWMAREPENWCDCTSSPDILDSERCLLGKMKLCNAKSSLKRILAENAKSDAIESFQKESGFFASQSNFKIDVIEEIAEFQKKFPNLESEIRILLTENSVVYLLGTVHTSVKCREDVTNVITNLVPNTVVVELCSLRICSCQKHKGNIFQSKPKFTFQYLRNVVTQIGFLPGLIFLADVFREQDASDSHMTSCSHHLIDFGGEFVAALTTASVLNCERILGDRPIEITVKRQASVLSNWRTIKVLIRVLQALMSKSRMKKHMLKASSLVFKDPRMYQVLVFERDLYLTHSIHTAAVKAGMKMKNGIPKVVAVVGQGHIPGILNYWGRIPAWIIPKITDVDADD